MGVNRVPFRGREFLGQRKLTVLAADSDPEILCMLQQLVPPDVYRIDQPDDASDLGELLRWLDVALVIVDIALIKADHTLRSHLQFRTRLGLPAIITSQDANPEDEILARSLGCVLYAPKPMGFWMLHQAVTELLCQPAGDAVG